MHWPSYLASGLLHLLLMILSGVWLAQSAQFGMESGENNVEVELVAAPASLSQAPSQPERPEPIPNAEKEGVMACPQPVPASPVPATATSIPAEHSQHGDGSSPVPGKDASTLRSEAGVRSVSKAEYLRNPPPSYPEKARREKRQGVVLLRVEVGEDGRAGAVEVHRSSSHRDLDEAALRAVRRWRFQPASLGGIRIASRVEVPIRFALE